MLNNVCLVGRITHDLELKHTPTNKSVVGFCLAVQRNGGADKEKICNFFDCVAWNKTAEIIVAYLKKGQLISIEGSLQTRTYETRDGHKKKVVEIIVKNFNFLGSKSSKEEPQDEYINVESDGDLPF